MYLRLLTLVTLLGFCIHGSNGDFEDCCISYAKSRNYKTLYKYVRYYQSQEINESCNRRAIVFHFKKHKVLCGNPHEQWVRDLMKQVDKLQYAKLAHKVYKEPAEIRHANGSIMKNHLH
ncbi:C-C motif chemokine 21a-like [Pelobates fuscus]|uniref:C-C motif chemokine 21a-like n=1 Tax=Pelobates fuscus TaxID=191477 RepID=UPI002FE4E9A7